MDSDDPMRISRHMYALISAGFYHQVREMVDRYGLSFVPEWGNGYGLVYHALSHRNLGIAKMLLSKGAEVNALFDVSSPLVLAVQLEDAETIQMLLDKGAKVNFDVKGGTLKGPLFHRLLESFDRLNRDVHLVERFLDQGADLAAVDSVGQTALFHAVNQRSKPLVELFLKRGAKADVHTNNLLTPLHVAADKCSKEIVEMLLDAGAAVDCRAGDAATPLHLASDRHDVASRGIVELLIRRGADVNLANEDGVTALHAAAGGNAQVVELLLSEDADINAETADARTPLHCAAASGNQRSVELLLDNGANVDAATRDLCTPLHYAVLNKHAKIAEVLLKNGADIDAETRDGKTCLLIAVEKSFVDIVDVLLRYRPDRSVNQACVQVAVRRCDMNNCHVYTVESVRSPIVEKLLEYGFCLRPQDVSSPSLAFFFSAVKNGFVRTAEAILEMSPNARALLSTRYEMGEKMYKRMPLHMAVHNRRLDMAKLLLRFGADVNAVSVENVVGAVPESRPLDFAVSNGDLSMFQLLVSQQADVIYDRELLLRAARSRVEIVDYLLEQGAYVNVRNRLRETPLHRAAGRGRHTYNYDYVISGEEAVKVTRLLLQKGAKVNARTCSGETPLMAAAATAPATAPADDTTAATDNERNKSDSGCQLVSLLLDHRADVNMRDSERRGSALDRSVARQNYQLSKLLLERGARINFRDEGYTRPLLSAAYNGNLDLVKLLVEFGVDENALSDNHMLWNDVRDLHALHMATHERHVPILEYLLECTNSSLNCCTQGRLHEYPIDIAYNFRGAWPEVYLFLVRHIVKAKAANLYVNQWNSWYGVPWGQRHEIQTLTLSFGSRSVTIAEFNDLCKAELSAMRNHKIQNTSLAFFNILGASTSKLVSMSRNKDLKQALSSASFLTKFPIYGSWILGRMSIGERRRSWYDQCTEVVRTMLPSFPCDCIHYVLDYLPTMDLRMLILASEPHVAYPQLTYSWYLRRRIAWTRSLWPKAAHRIPTKRKRNLKQLK